jgi:predicted metal-dependent enzyme (double-stranded beta helix superfamily)
VDPTGIESLPQELLVALAIESGETEGYSALAEPGRGERSFACVLSTPAYDVWLIRWGPGSATALHDHGDSAGAVYVVAGELIEHVAEADASGLGRQVLATFDHRVMTPSHIHSIANESGVGAASVHVYSPPLVTMHHYEMSNEATPEVTHRETISAEDQEPRISSASLALAGG